jgi:hypothetical protein
MTHIRRTRMKQPPLNEVRPCPCGSGKPSRWQYDARSIALCRTCNDCHETKMATYRPEVLNDPNYQSDEPIDDD